MGLVVVVAVAVAAVVKAILAVRQRVRFHGNIIEVALGFAVGGRDGVVVAGEPCIVRAVRTEEG